MNKSNMAYPVDGMVTSFGKCLCVCIVVYISGVIPVVPCTLTTMSFSSHSNSQGSE